MVLNGLVSYFQEGIDQFAGRAFQLVGQDGIPEARRNKREYQAEQYDHHDQLNQGIPTIRFPSS